MIGILLTTIGTFLDEISSTAGQWNINHRKESLYTFGFLNLFWALLFFIILAIVRQSFVFDVASVPLTILFIIAEIAQIFSTLHAIVIAERSTWGFLQVLTIPSLLLVDTLLGYQLTLDSLIGISIIIISLLFLFINHGLNSRGMGYILFSTFNAVLTLSLYKYLITNYNSVEAQQIVSIPFFLIFLFIMARWKSQENPLKFLFKKEFIIQSFSKGIGGMLISFGYLYAPASVISSARRGTAIMAAIITGNTYFHEKHIVIKLLAFVGIISGLILLVV